MAPGSDGAPIRRRSRRSPPFGGGEGLDHKVPQRDEVLFAPRGVPPGEADRAAWLGRGKL